MTNTTSLTTIESMVLEFQEAFNVKHPPEVSKRLIQEELAEVEKAAAELLKEICDLMYVYTSSELLGTPVDNDDGTHSALLADLLEAFPDDTLAEAFTRVHESNMSKLVDGKPLLREDGKILKGPNYKPPYLLDLLA